MPIAFGEDGWPRVLLVTSRETGRWIIPKGWPAKGLEPPALAAREAFEEAGLEGRIETEAIGSYRYAKLLRGKRATKSIPCEVTVFPLWVERELDRWPEHGQRQRRWFTPTEAAALVEEEGLAAILLTLPAPRAQAAGAAS